MEFYGFPKITLAMSNVEAKALIADVGTELTNQLEEELGQANVTLGPAAYSQAMKSEDVDKWIDAMHEEKSSLESQSVWEVHDITDLPKERKGIGSC